MHSYTKTKAQVLYNITCFVRELTLFFGIFQWLPSHTYLDFNAITPCDQSVCVIELPSTLFDLGTQFLGWVILGTWGRNGFFHFSKFSFFTIFIAIFRFLYKLVNVRFFKLLGTVFHLRIWYLGWENLVQLEIKDF